MLSTFTLICKYLEFVLDKKKDYFIIKIEGDQMTTKEKIKRRIDLLPDELLDQVQIYLDNIKTQQKITRKIHTLHLKGQYDHLNVRQKAYE